MKSRILIIFAVVVLSIFPTSNMADTVEFEFSGFIDIINSNENNALGNVYLNQPFDGWFTYSSVPDQSSDPVYGSYGQDASISVTLGTQIISYIDDYVIIVVSNNDYTGADSFLHVVDATQGDFSFTYYGVDLTDSTGMVFNNDDLPMSFDLAQFDSSMLVIAGYKLPNWDWFYVGGEITNMTLIPEPATLLLLGLGGLALLRKRKG